MRKKTKQVDGQRLSVAVTRSELNAIELNIEVPEAYAKQLIMVSTPFKMHRKVA